MDLIPSLGILEQTQDGSFAQGWKVVSAEWQRLCSPQFIILLNVCTHAFSIMMLFGPHLLRFSVPSLPLTSVLDTSGKTNNT